MDNLSSTNKELVRLLVDMGWHYEPILNTNAHALSKNKHHLYFLDDINPLVPLIYSVFIKNKIYTSDILENNGLKSYCGENNYTKYRAFITTDGDLRVAGSIDKNILQNLKAYSLRVLKAFPGSAYICMDVFTPIDLNSENMVSGISFELDEFLIKNNLKNEDDLDVFQLIAEIINNKH